jgi:chloramphenicol-sensitive protein RarD
MPVAVYLTHTGLLPYSKFFDQPTLSLVIIGLGILSAIGLGSYILASRFLPLVVFGLLGYLEPVLLALASLVLGESIGQEEWFTYLPIWCAVFVLVLEGAIHLYQQQQKAKNLQLNIEKYQKRLKNDEFD